MAAQEKRTQVWDLPEVCLALAIALTSPRDASRCAAVSPAFRAAADSDDVWHRFIPKLDDHRVVLQAAPPPASRAKSSSVSKKDAYLGLCDAATVVSDDGGCRVWLERASGARCYALSARRLSLPWDDGEFSWRWTPHPLSRFPEVAELVDCMCLDIYGRLPAAALTPGTTYAAYLVYGTTAGHRGLSFPDQETTVTVGATVARHAVCLCPDDAEERRFMGGDEHGGDTTLMSPRRRDDGWWEMEMGRVRTTEDGGGEEVVATFEVMGWYPKRGLIVEGIEFRPAALIHY